MDALIHYPTIEVPDSTWTTHTLLYWDEVATIVPPDIIEAPEQLSDFNLALVQAGLLHQLPVASMGNKSESYKLVETASRAFEKYLRGLTESRLDARREQFEAGRTTPLYKSKATYSLLFRLRNLGLADERFEPPLVEEATATDYVAVLACAFAREFSKEPGNRWVIGTSDQHDLLTLLAPSGANDEAEDRLRGHAGLETLQRAVLERLLPVPDEPMEAEQLVEFRRTYGPLLPSFRRFVDEKVEELSQISAEKRVRAIDRFESECEEKAGQAEELLRTSGVRKLRRNSVFGLWKKTPVAGQPTEMADAALSVVFGNAEDLTGSLAYAIFYRASFSDHSPQRPAVEVA